ncbi:MAG TPA: SMP-30/gluconolactonase/LRE family protein [Caulobacteraceae bacterium]|jgi:sugar lactone lactonase YvrE|nr:SMP-30/gluconolactonase/LRE family protein [Caulobacteraceae bacterium]
MARTLKTLLDGLAFPEGPRWRDGRLWFSDMHAHEVVAMAPDGSRETVVAADGPVSGLGWLPDGRMLIVSMNDRKLMRREADGRLVEHGDLSAIADYHCNDMVVDAAGRAYVGNFGWNIQDPAATRRPARMARVDPDGKVSVAADELVFPNGTVITDDGKTLVVGESFAGRMTAFDIGPAGELTNRRLWAQLPEGAVPDGCCLDAEGAIWVASPTTNDVIRIFEGGRVGERITADQGVFACMLGGSDRKTLYVLTSKGSDPEQCRAHRSGRIEAVEVDVAGAGLP